MEINNLDDESLIDLYQKHKDNDAIGILYKRYSMLVFGLAFKYFKQEDAVMPIYITINSAIVTIFQIITTMFIVQNLNNFLATLPYI